MSRVLVTGGAGYVGSHTSKALSRAGLTPVVFDNLSGGRPDFVRWGPLERGDIMDAAALDAAIEHHHPTAVLHFAGRIEAGESVLHPDVFYAVNVQGTLNVLAAMRRHSIRTLVFSSSAAVYGAPQHVPIDESAAIAPTSPYGHSKAMSETMIRDFAAAFGIRYIALRYFNAAGADEDAELGESHHPETHALPLAIAAARGGAPFRMHGTDYPTPDGTAIRDYVHVADLADAHVAALRHLDSGGESQALNLGAEHGISVRRLVAAVTAAGGTAVPCIEGPRRAGDPPLLQADSHRAREVLGWRAHRSSLDNIVKTAWRWHASADGESKASARQAGTPH